jgi:hypothetical protein
MNKYKTLMAGFALLVGLLFANSNSTFAQQERGDQEIQINGNVNFNAKDIKNTANGSIGLAYGYFLTEKHQVGFQGITAFSGGGTTFFGEGFYRYNLKASEKLRPYVGVATGSFGSTSDTSAAFGNNAYVKPNAGFKYYFKRNVAFDLNGGYQVNFKKPAFSPRTHNIDVRMGIALIF